MTTPEDPRSAIRDAATIILLRRNRTEPAILMGMRGARAAFMPSQYVFPGGAVDPCDHTDAPKLTPAAEDIIRLAVDPCVKPGIHPHALINCAHRELTEETGLTLRPDATLHFVFRAITPPGRTRRFDARFFLADAQDVIEDSDDFSAADDELSHLHWVPLAEARTLNLPFVTEIALAEVQALLEIAGDGPLPRPAQVPFFDGRDEEPRFYPIS